MSFHSRSPDESRHSRSRNRDRSRSRSRSPSKQDGRRSRDRQRKSRWHDDDKRDHHHSSSKSYYHHDDRSHRRDDERSGYHDDDRKGGDWRKNQSNDKVMNERRPSEGDRDYEEPRGRKRDASYNRDNHGHSRKDEEDASHPSKQLSSVPPGPILMFRNLSSFILKEHLTQALGHQMSYIKDIRLISGRENSSNYAFVEFFTTNDAVNWMEANKNGFEVRGCHVNIDFSHHRSIDGNDKRKKEFKWSDWNCFKCGTLNFSRRTVCLTCDCARAESDSLHEDRRAGLLPEIEAEEEASKNNAPSNVLIFRGLDGLSTEDTIRSAIADVSNIKIKDVRLIKDKATNTSRRFCFVETITAEEAAELNKILLQQTPAFFVDGRRINVSYARIHNALPKPANAVAAAAIQQALSLNMPTSAPPKWPTQQQNLPQSSSTMATDSTHIPTSSSSAADQTASNIPSTYLYDSTSGFYYDTTTGLYYDPKTQYHYNSQTGQYCYYDVTKQAYIPVTSDGVPITDSTNVAGDQSKDKKKTDVTVGSLTGKNAKKIAKDMERWAKSINNQKAQQQQLINQIAAVQAHQHMEEPSSVYQHHQHELVQSPTEPSGGVHDHTTAPFRVKDSSVPMVSEKPSGLHVVDTEHEDTPPVGSGGDMEFADMNNLACLLCKRKFNSKEQLMKHVQLSDLHKQNLEKLSKSSGGSSTSGDQSNMYRDRAKERRAKYGLDAVVPGWKKRFERERAKTLAEGGDTSNQQLSEVSEPESENVGSKMLKAMGWNEGQGLGKEGQGIIKPIEAEKRTPNAGLGTPGSNYGAGGIYSSGNDYRATLKSLTKARYDQMFDN